MPDAAWCLTSSIPPWTFRAAEYAHIDLTTRRDGSESGRQNPAFSGPITARNAHSVLREIAINTARPSNPVSVILQICIRKRQ